MSEHPILFSGSMVRAIIEVRKTQARRMVLGPEKYMHMSECAFACPYGRSGDTLWVRETWIEDTETDRGDSHGELIYAADGEPAWKWPGWRWRPSIHMPRWASRLTLRITDVRVQRLQDITCRDARAEGIEPKRFEVPAVPGHMGYSCDQVISDFAQMWDSINGKRGPWDSNPWVWALTFEKV